ncbi:MAG: methyltransferase [Hyphomicrobiales bacterium]|nr:methyltransferase [Hyphomicrobiales bacterium]
MAASAFIAANLPLRPVPGLSGISIHTAVSGSGLRRLAAGRNPYWAWCWAGGLALAQHLAARPETVAGKGVLDLGAGSGLVGIAAAKAGARAVLAVDVDEDAVAAIELNARANRVSLAVLHDDILDDVPPPVDVALVGDLFYDRDVAARVTRFLDACVAAGTRVYVGDPFRAFLPRERLNLIASYATRDFGLRDDEEMTAAVFSFVANSA